MTSTRRFWLAAAALAGFAGSSHRDLQLLAAEAPGTAERLTLGVQFQGAGPPCAAASPEPGGVCVVGVRPGAAAERGGLRPGDTILRIDQTRITDPSLLISQVQGLHVGQTVEITYVRAGETRRASVLLETGDQATPTAAGAALSVPVSGTDRCEDTMQPGSTTGTALPFRKQPLALDRVALETLLGDKPASITLHGDVLTLAFRASGSSANLVGGSIQCALDHVGASLWALQLRMPQWRQVFLSARFMATQEQSSDPPGLGTRPATAEATYRGRAALPAPSGARPLRGRLIHATVASRFLDSAKQVSVYLPPGSATAHLPVLYMTDGQDLPPFAAIVEGLIRTRRIRPIAIVAEHHGDYTGDSSRPYEMQRDNRMREYLPVADPPYFARHMRFFVEELLPWAEQQYGLSAARTDRAAMGYSNGGAFVGQLGVQHPESFAAVLPFSPAFRISWDNQLPGDAASLPRFLFAGGELETSFLDSARADAQWLKARGVSTALRTYWSGHDTLQWQQALAEYLPEVFAPTAK